MGSPAAIWGRVFEFPVKSDKGEDKMSGTSPVSRAGCAHFSFVIAICMAKHIETCMYAFIQTKHITNVPTHT